MGPPTGLSSRLAGQVGLDDKKLHFLDPGLLAALLGVTRERVDDDRTVFGPILRLRDIGDVGSFRCRRRKRNFTLHSGYGYCINVTKTPLLLTLVDREDRWEDG